MKRLIFYLKKPAAISVIAVFFTVGISFAYFGRSGHANKEFVLAARQDITQEVNVTGRVKAAESVDLAFNITGRVAWTPVDVGDKVSVGQVLMQLNSRDAQRNIGDAEIDLENARITLQKISLEQGQIVRGDTLNKAYEKGLQTLALLYGDFSATLDSLDHIFFDKDLSNDKNNIEYYSNHDARFADVPNLVLRIYSRVKNMHREGLGDYQLAERGSGEARGKAIKSGYELTIKTAEMIKSARDAVRSYKDYLVALDVSHTRQSVINKHESELTEYAEIIDEHLSDLLETVNTIKREYDSTNQYPLDAKFQELVVKQRENDLKEARDKYNDHFIFASQSGVVTKKVGKVGEIISANITAISVISESKFEIEANVPEADIAKVSVGNLATVTLDAYGRDVIFDAKIVSANPAETIIEGVATYKVTLQFVSEDNRVKSGMTANINILSDRHENAIVVPQRAVIRKNGEKFIRTMEGNNIKEIAVETGLRSSDGMIEINNGINEGDKVIIFDSDNN